MVDELSRRLVPDELWELAEPLLPKLALARRLAGRRRPGKLHADKAYDQPEPRRWIRHRGMSVRIARKGIESTERLGRHRWVIERTISWLATTSSTCDTTAREPTSWAS
ncbi:transposase [Nocardia gipuzkoensis]